VVIIITIKTRAANNSKMTLSNLVYSINGTTTALGDLFSEGKGSSDIDYLRLSGVSKGFKVTGKASMSWVGATPLRSNLAFQMKVGNSEEKKKVPEPTAIAGIVLAGIAMAGSKRQKETENAEG
jgi:hypothetical protein